MSSSDREVALAAIQARKSREKVLFEKLDLREVDFEGHDLSEVTFVDCDLSRARFSVADCARAVFRVSNLQGARFHGADLEGVRFVNSPLVDADFDGANLAGADLFCADLRGANLRFARLEGADTGSAQFHGATLREDVLIDSLQTFDGLYLYTVQSAITTEGAPWVRMGCLLESVANWDAIGVRESNLEEFPDDGSFASEQRVQAFEFAKARALLMAEEWKKNVPQGSASEPQGAS